MILAVRRNILFEKGYFQGFSDKVNYKKIILGNMVWVRRSEAEKSPELKHPISYSMIVNPSKKQVFTFQRAKGDYDEKRLREKWSWGVGGPIEFIDNSKDPIQKAFLRELEEEVIFEGETKNRTMKNLGYINDDEDDVGRVHFGLLYVIKTNADSVLPNPENQGIFQGRLMRLAELEVMCRNPEKLEVERWSRIALPHLKKYLE